MSAITGVTAKEIEGFRHKFYVNEGVLCTTELNLPVTTRFVIPYPSGKQVLVKRAIAILDACDLKEFRSRVINLELRLEAVEKIILKYAID